MNLIVEMGSPRQTVRKSIQISELGNTVRMTLCYTYLGKASVSLLPSNLHTHTVREKYSAGLIIWHFLP